MESFASAFPVYSQIGNVFPAGKSGEFRVKRERDQQDATSLMFIIKLLSQHVSGIIMPIIRRTRVEQ